jgi:proteasome lid subunit RPN8/RPN11
MQLKMESEKYLADTDSKNTFKPLELAGQVVDTINDHSIEEYPSECCGFLFGIEGAVRSVTLARPVRNSAIENQRRRFEISPKDYMEAETFAEQNKISILGVYHSHPDHPAVPSVHDFRQAVPFFSYIIASVMKGKVEQVRSWQIDDQGLFAEEKVLANSR